jgi:transcriptional regulator with XRE-family HTH domain
MRGQTNGRRFFLSGLSALVHSTGMSRLTTHDPMAVKLGIRVRTLRMERGMTMEELAEASGVSLGQLANIENGQSSLGVRTLGQLAQALNMPPVLFVIFPDDGGLDGLLEQLRKLPPDELNELLERELHRPR